MALVSGAMLGAMVIGTQAVNADTKIDSNHIRVEQGDTVSEIAQKHNVSVDSLVQANHLSNPDMIFVGDTLVLTPNASNNENATKTPSYKGSQHMYQPVHMIENNENNNQPTTNTQQSAPVATSTTGGSSEQAAKDWIAQHESGGSYSAMNGQYVGKFQLSSSYLNGDYSPANQERVADQYVDQRYGSWTAAKNFWLSHNYY